VMSEPTDKLAWTGHVCSNRVDRPLFTAYQRVAASAPIGSTRSFGLIDVIKRFLAIYQEYGRFVK